MSLKHWVVRSFAALLLGGLALGLLSRPSEAALPPPVPGQVVTYNGGDVLLNVDVQAMYYGQEWKTNQALVAQKADFEKCLQFLVNSPYMDMLTDAGYTDGAGNKIGRGKFTPGATDPTAVPKGATLTDDQIQTMLQRCITNKVLAAPNPNRLYVFFAPPNVLVKKAPEGDSAHNFLGYHSGFTGRNAQGQAVPVWYAVIPYPGGSVGNGKITPLTDFQSMTAVTSHELAESVTDAYQPRRVPAWYNRTTGDEISDIAYKNGNYIVFLNNYAVYKAADKMGKSISPAGSVAGPPLKKKK